MRYIGNKTRLLGFIRSVLRDRGIGHGIAIDPFSGTASVASALKRWGFRVVAGDLMECAYVFGRAYVQAAAEPRFDDLAAELDGFPPTLAGVIALLNRLPPDAGFIHEHFTLDGEAGRQNERMYFTPTNAARIDAIRSTIERWRREGRVDDDGFFLLLASLLHAADRVANTAGVYAACIKSWQPNARRTLQLRKPRVVPGEDSCAVRIDAQELLENHEPFELLYLDPPYNTRQYPAYYHIPELIAMGWFDGPVVLRGKTGLLLDADKRSAWSRQKDCEEAFERLVATARCKHIVMSYNAEGIIPETTIARVLRSYGRASTYRRYRRLYRRYRSDSDGKGRTYRGDEVHEYLYCVSR